MVTKAVRLYGKDDLRLDTFALPQLSPEELLIEVVTDSLCMSTYKTVKQGKEHYRVPSDVENNPVITGHEFCGRIVEVGTALQEAYAAGEKIIVVPTIDASDKTKTIGYGFHYIGGSMTYGIVPAEAIANGCVLKVTTDSYYKASLVEPLSCVIHAFRSNFHTSNNALEHHMGIREGGNVAILAGCGPMGLAAIGCALNFAPLAKRVVVTDIDEGRLLRARSMYASEDAATKGIELIYSHITEAETLMGYTGGEGYDDVFVFAPVKAVVETAGRIIRQDGCLNFFAGPMDSEFSAELNFYNVHYASSHVVGTSGSDEKDIMLAVHMINKGKIDPSGMVTHIGGLDCVSETVKKLPDIKGGKKLIYTGTSLPLTALEDLVTSDNEILREAGRIVLENGGIWCPKAEAYLLSHM